MTATGALRGLEAWLGLGSFPDSKEPAVYEGRECGRHRRFRFTPLVLSIRIGP